jgi:hypothetical protein
LRLSKPFDPLLGETFELSGQGWTFLAEQVSADPAISASHAESNHYELFSNTTSKLKVGFGSATNSIVGLQHVRLKSAKEHYSF